MKSGRVKKVVITFVVYLGILTLIILVGALLDFIQFGEYKSSLSKSFLSSVLTLSVFSNMNLSIDVIERTEEK